MNVRKKLAFVYLLIGVIAILSNFLYQREKTLLDDFMKEHLITHTWHMTVEYKSVVLDLNEDNVADKYAYSRFLGDLDIPKRENISKKDVPSEDPIVITVQDEGVIKIYPYEDDSKIIEFKKRFGITRRYVLSGFGNFERLLDTLYDLTGNDIFITS